MGDNSGCAQSGARGKKAKKTRIMQMAYLNWKNFQRHFDFLLKEGFIKECNPEEGYELSEKGSELLRRLKEVEVLIGKL